MPEALAKGSVPELNAPTQAPSMVDESLADAQEADTRFPILIGQIGAIILDVGPGSIRTIPGVLDG